MDGIHGFVKLSLMGTDKPILSLLVETPHSVKRMTGLVIISTHDYDPVWIVVVCDP